MNDEERRLLHDLLTRQRVLSLSVLVDGKPHVGLLPFVAKPELGAALVHASDLAQHSRGLRSGAPYAALIHLPDHPDADPLQLPRVSLEGMVTVLDRDTPEYHAGRERFLARFPASAVTFGLGDFRLYELGFERGRLVAGFARARTVTATLLRDLAAGGEGERQA